MASSERLVVLREIGILKMLCSGYAERMSWEVDGFYGSKL
jgi:hypothetical protein